MQPADAEGREALAGAGALIFDPTDKFVVTGADRQTRGTFVYGGGANFDITKNFGVRAEYRGLLYKVPDFGLNNLVQWIYRRFGAA